MSADSRHAYTALWAFALAFGFIEAMVVVYLREISMQQLALQGTNSLAGLRVTEIALPERYVRLEVVREACTMILLAAGAWLAGRRSDDRAGAFLLSFGVWDLMYYAALHVVEHWPVGLTDWDILFLIPVPWVAPVWAPILVATIFVVVGTYLFWTPGRERLCGWFDAAVFAGAALIIIAAFVRESSAAIDHHAPESFPVWLFGIGVALGVGWFIRIEVSRAG
jgi:hypothetical protein